MSNAAQAARSGGIVTVGAREEPSSVTISITDDGAGMSGDVRERAGQPVFSTKPQGTGLGLAIARRIATAHGAALTIDSEPGSGTTVHVRFQR